MVPGKKSSIVIQLSNSEKETLLSWTRSTKISAGLSKRAQIILLFAEQMPISHISLKLGIKRDKISKWGRRFLERRIDGLQDKSGRGRKAFFPSGSGCALGQIGL